MSPQQCDWKNKYDEFVKDIMVGRYAVGCKKIFWLLDNRLNNNYDNNMRLYLILLEKILGLKESLIDSFEFILEGNDNNFNHSFYSYYFDFLKLIEKLEFDKAYHQLKEFIRFERNHKKFNSENTIVVYKLIAAIIEKNKVDTDKEIAVKQDEISDLDDSNLKDAIKNLNIKFIDENLLVVESLLKERIDSFSVDDDIGALDRYAYDLIKTFRIVQDGKIPF